LPLIHPTERINKSPRHFNEAAARVARIIYQLPKGSKCHTGGAAERSASLAARKWTPESNLRVIEQSSAGRGSTKATMFPDLEPGAPMTQTKTERRAVPANEACQEILGDNGTTAQPSEQGRMRASSPPSPK